MMRPQCLDKLAKFAAWAEENPGSKIALDAHQREADDRGQSLAPRRVVAVKNELVRLGVSSHRIVIGGYGSSLPLCNTGTTECLEQHRRVEVLAVRP